MSRILFFVVSFALALYSLIPWIVFIPLAIPLWFVVIVFSFGHAILPVVKQKSKSVVSVFEIFSRIYLIIFVLLLLCFTFFVMQLHPFIVFLSWILTLLFMRRLSFFSVIPLQVLNILFIVLVQYDAVHAPYAQKLAENSCVTVKYKTWHVRNIFTDDNEETLYFTAHNKGIRYGKKTRTFFKMSLQDSRVESLSYYFSHNGIYDKKRKVIYLTSNDTGEILVVSPTNLKILRRMKVFGKPTDIFMDEKRDRIIVLFEKGIMAAFDPETLYMISSCFSESITNFVEGSLARNHEKIYISRPFTPWTLVEADLKTCKLGRKKLLGLTSLGITTDRDEKLIYVTDFLLGTLFVVDRQSFRVVKRKWIKSGIRPVELDEKRGLIYVANYLNPYLYILDRGLRVIKKVYIGNPCRDIRLLKNGRLFVGTSIGLLEVNVDKCLL